MSSSANASVSPKLHIAQFDCRSQATIEQRTNELTHQNDEWLQSQPEIKEIMADFMQSLLFHKPDDALGFMKQYFTDVRATAGN